MQRRKGGALSGGEKNRLLLARLLLQGANLLVLDEPTNDLDILTLEVLEEMLLGFGGSVILVTHDRYFIDKVATSILAFEGDGRVVRYAGNHDMYLRLRAQNRPAAPEKPVAPAPVPSRKELARLPQDKKPLTLPEWKRLDAMEALIETAEGEKARLEQALADPELYRTRSGDVAGLRAELARASEAVEQLYAEWQLLESRRDIART